MNYDPRTIALLSEIIYPPIELQATAVQAIHNQLFSDEFSYQNFAVTGDGISLSNQLENPGGVSMVNYLPDRIQVREELSGAHVDDFERRVEQVLRISLAQLGLPVLVAHQHVVRSLINAKSFTDSRDFLAAGVCQLDPTAFAPFERPVGLFGMKLIFPVIEGSDDFHQLLIESFNQDPRSVFLENVTTYTSPVMPDDVDKIAHNVRRTYDFVRNRALAFVAQYDKPKKAPE